MRLTVGLATRGRPELAAWAAKQAKELARDPATCVVILADADDAPIEAPAGVMLSVEPREDSVGAKFNRMLRVAPADVYMSICDYRAQASAGYDVEILKGAAKFKDE